MIMVYSLRKVGNKAELAFKSSRKDDNTFLICEELETTVNDFEIMEHIINNLGLVCIRDREKKRTSFVLKNVKLEIDEYSGISPYLEIEGSKKEVMKAVKLLGFEMKDTVNLTASAVLRLNNKNQNFLKFKR